MIYHRISDWTDAYSNGIHIAGGDRWPEAWVAPAAAFRERLVAENRAELGIAYGPGERNRFDLFLPSGEPAGLVVFVHGGYWMNFDSSSWSHLAAGPVAAGYAVAMPMYTLCPQVRISAITREIGAAIDAAAARIAGPIALTGHSAGGHLVSRMICAASPLSPATLARIRNTVSISGLHDLRPLMRAKLNDTLRLDDREAVAESPALLEPVPGARLFAWVGLNERAEFIRQSELLTNIWRGLGASTAFHAEPDRHHFDIVDGLTDAEHPLTRVLLS